MVITLNFSMLIKTRSADQICTVCKERKVKGMFVVVTEREVHSYIKTDIRREVMVTGREICLGYELTVMLRKLNVSKVTLIIRLVN